VSFPTNYLPSQAASVITLIESTSRKVASAADGTVEIAVSAARVPIDVARSSLHIIRLTEELLEEVVFLLRSMRPVVEAVSTAQQTDHFDTVYRTLGQIGHSADAMTRSPIGVVRSVLGPARTLPGAGLDPVEPSYLLRTPTVAVSVASITLTVPSIAVGKSAPPLG
jgi:hypothetical protein